MHSYTNRNRDLREEYLNDLKQKKSSNSLYPANINIRNFNYFLLAPTLCYEPEYPRSGKFRLWYAINKGVQCFGSLVTFYFCFLLFGFMIIKFFFLIRFCFILLLVSLLCRMY